MRRRSDDWVGVSEEVLGLDVRGDVLKLRCFASEAVEDIEVDARDTPSLLRTSRAGCSQQVWITLFLPNVRFWSVGPEIN